MSRSVQATGGARMSLKHGSAIVQELCVMRVLSLHCCHTAAQQFPQAVPAVSQAHVAPLLRTHHRAVRSGRRHGSFWGNAAARGAAQLPAGLLGCYTLGVGGTTGSTLALPKEMAPDRPKWKQRPLKSLLPAEPVPFQGLQLLCPPSRPSGQYWQPSSGMCGSGGVPLFEFREIRTSSRKPSAYSCLQVEALQGQLVC